MIKVSCSKLEEVRQNPYVFAQQLLSSEKKTGGYYGMFASWQTCVKSMHSGEMDLSRAMKSLQQRFMAYAENGANRRKQEFLLDRLSPYWNEFHKREYNYLAI